MYQYLFSTNPDNYLSKLQQKPEKPHFMGGCYKSSMELSDKKSNQNLIIATLNYGGILNSPFEFYSNEQAEEKQISNHFKSLIQHYYKNFDQKNFSWKIGKIDQKIQKQRYTPIYSPTAGIQNGKLISAQKFKQKWDSNFQKALPKAKLQKAPTQEQIQCMKTFDLICFHALLRYVYNVNNIAEVENHDAVEYSKLLQKFFSRSFLDEGKKLKLMANLLDQKAIDIFFFQQPTSVLADCLKKDEKFKVFQGTKDNSIIAIRSNTRFGANAIGFDNIKQKAKISQDNIKKIEANPQTRIVFSENIILICVHLSSKPEKNKKELEELREGIHILKQAFPDHELIIGGDTNAFIKEDQIQDVESKKRIHIYPNNPKDITTCKTRTYMQPQFNKADKMADECKDQLMSTMEMIRHYIVTIDLKPHEKPPNLPTESHPFDHMLVYCEFNTHKTGKK